MVHSKIHAILAKLDYMTRSWQQKRVWKISLRYPKSRTAMKEFISELWKNGKKPILYLAGLGILMLILTPILTYAYFVRDLSSKESILNRKNAGVVLQDRNGTPFFTFYEARTKNNVPLDQIPEYAQEAVIASEDKDFYSHPGFSIEGIGRALLANIKSESISQGGSTLSQQLIKNTLLTHDQTFLRKYQEIFLALELERRFSKNDILEMYLNTAYFGEGAFGIQDAAKTYFSKNASDLTVGESALMAAILPAPSALSPISGNKERAFARQKVVLEKMLEQGYITSVEKEAAENEEIAFNPSPSDLNREAPHFALMVKDELIDKYGEQRVANSGFVVKTTLDLEGQKYAQQVVANQVQRLAQNNVTNGSAVVMDPETGEILALVGSHDWADEQNGKINMAIRPRQPGSSFKPIVYAKALEERLITPATVLKDEKITFPGGYTPRNYDNRFRGDVLARYALANSLNIPAVLVMQKVGVADTISFARELGITTLDQPDRYGLSLVLGAAEVPLTQMTGAFAVFANEGTKVEPTTILEIKDKKDNVIYTNKPSEERVVPRSVAYQISSILSDNKARSDIFGGALSISRQAAVKTGTTEDYRDAVTIGYTPNLVVGAWVGNNDREPMDNVAGSLGAAPIWRQLMEYFFRSRPNVPFTPPNGLVKVDVCANNGLRAEVATSSAYPEYFLPGTTPKESCITPTPTPEESPTPTPEEEDEAEETPTPTPTNTPEPTRTPTRTPTPTPTKIIEEPIVPPPINLRSED